MVNRSGVLTPFGTVSILWTKIDDHPKIVRILLPNSGLSSEDLVPKLYPHLQFSSCPEIDETARRINGFLEGEEIEFSLDSVKFSLCSEFQQQVLRAVKQALILLILPSSKMTRLMCFPKAGPR